MTRYHTTTEGDIPFTSEEEAARDVEEAQVPQRLAEKNNAWIKVQLAALDLKRIRPAAEGDTECLAELNAQAIALRGQLA